MSENPRPKTRCHYCGLGKTREVSLHRFPVKDEPRRKLWIHILGLQNSPHIQKFRPQDLRICSTHFSEKQKYRSYPRPRLVWNAVPDILLPNTSEQSKKLASMLRPRTQDHVAIVPKRNEPVRVDQKRDISETSPDPSSTTCVRPPLFDHTYVGVNRAFSFEVLNSSQHINNTSTDENTNQMMIENRMIQQEKHLKKYHKKLLRYKCLAKNTKNLFVLIRKMLKNKFIRKILQGKISAYTLFSGQLKHHVERENCFTKKELLWALSLCKKDPIAYEFLKHLVALPTLNELNDLVTSIPFGPGVNSSYFEKIKSLVENLEPSERIVALLFEDINIIDFKNNSSSTKASRNFAYCLQETTVGTPESADSGVIFMVRGLRSNWKQPIGYFFVKGSTPAEVIKGLIIVIVRALQECHLKVVSSISNSEKIKQDTIQLLINEKNECERNGDLVYEVFGQKIVHFYDTPYLLKKLKEILHETAIDMGNRQISKWEHIEDFYQCDKLNFFPVAPKLTDNHFNFDFNQNWNQTELATQIFSYSVAAGIMSRLPPQNQNIMITPEELEQTKDSEGFLPIQAQYTSLFLYEIDQLFDSFNGENSNTEPKKVLRKRLTNHSKHFSYWKQVKEIIENWECVNPDGTRFRHPSFDAWISNLRSIELLWPILVENGFKSFNMRFLNQDPLEHLLDIIREHGIAYIRPTCKQIITSMKTCILTDLKPQFCSKKLSNYSCGRLLTNFHSFLNINKEKTTARQSNFSESSIGNIFII